MDLAEKKKPTSPLVCWLPWTCCLGSHQGETEDNRTRETNRTEEKWALLIRERERERNREKQRDREKQRESQWKQLKPDCTRAW
jgi:hypothetical protein